jgi:hypothetical protein
MKLEDYIYNIIQQKGDVSKQDIMDSLANSGESYSANYISVALQNMMKKEVIIRERRGIYTAPSDLKPHFYCPAEDDLISLYKNLHLKFPFTEFCIWHSRYLTAFMHHIPNVNITIVGCEKIAMQAVKSYLVENSTCLVMMDSEKSIIETYSVGAPVIVIVPLVSRSPIEWIKETPFPKLEKILVDILCDNIFFYIQGAEVFNLYETAFEAFQINTRMLYRYAKRRNRNEQIQTIIKDIEL